MLSTLSRPRGQVMLAVVLVVLLAAGGTWWVRSRSAAADPVADPGTRTLTAGEVTVQITALSLDASGARFDVTVDTHSGDLDLDMARAGQLRINQQPAGPGSWSGSGPGGHHREGVLTYATAVPPGADVELRLSGLPQEVAATWTAP